MLTYSVTYTNTTNTARDVTITDVIPEHTTYVDGSADNGGTYDPATRTVTWTQNVASGDTLTVTFQVKVNKGEKDVTVVNTAPRQRWVLFDHRHQYHHQPCCS